MMIVVVQLTQPQLEVYRHIYSTEPLPHGVRKPLPSHMVPTALHHNAWLAHQHTAEVSSK
jgi:hypothetical protein